MHTLRRAIEADTVDRLARIQEYRTAHPDATQKNIITFLCETKYMVEKQSKHARGFTQT